MSAEGNPGLCIGEYTNIYNIWNHTELLILTEMNRIEKNSFNFIARFRHYSLKMGKTEFRLWGVPH
jgi:hypothetical protein